MGRSNNFSNSNEGSWATMVIDTMIIDLDLRSFLFKSVMQCSAQLTCTEGHVAARGFTWARHTCKSVQLNPGP